MLPLTNFKQENMNLYMQYYQTHIPTQKKTEIEREEGECNIPENLEAEKVWAFRERETR